MTTLDEAYEAEGIAPPKKRGGIKPEHMLQIACKQWLTEALPPAVMWTAVDKATPMSGPDKRRAMVIQAMLKARGIKNGVLDFHFWWQGVYLAVELKAGKGITSDAEDGWIEGLRREGFRAEVAWSVSQLEAHLRAAGFPVRASAKGIDERLPLRKKAGASGRVSKPRTLGASQRAVRVGNWSQRVR